jgi:hypothetical protein
MPLSDAHRRHLLSAFLTIERQLAELETLIEQAAHPTPFSTVADDVSPAEAELVVDQFARLRGAMLTRLKELEIAPAIRQTSLRWALQSSLTHLQVTIDDMGPKGFARYGPLDATEKAAISTIQEDLTRLLAPLLTHLRQGSGKQQNP